MQSYEYTYNGYTINIFGSPDDLLGGVSDCNTSRSKKIIAVHKVTGFTSPEIRHSESVIIGNHGIVDHLSYIGSRLITLEGILYGANENETLELMEDLNFYWNVADIPTPSNNGYAPLTFSKPGEPSKFVNAKIHSLSLVERELQARKKYSFQVQFRCEDPRIYSTIQKTLSLDKAVLASGFPNFFPIMFGASGYLNDETAISDGNWSAPVEYTIENVGSGTVQSPRITNETRGTYQEFNMEMDPGDTITVDTLQGTAVDQDGNSVLKFETELSSWIYISPRSTDTLRVTSMSGIPSATLSYRDTWISAPR